MSDSSPKVLLVDDDSDIHLAVRLILEPAGYEVICRSTGSAGLEAVHNDRPDLILLDIMLASPTEGLELAAKLKEDEATRSIPIIMISSIGQQMHADLARDSGVGGVQAERFLEKPLAAMDLQNAVREVLEQSGSRE